MRVILKQDVENLGRKGDIVNVASGYGRNYLIPRRMALEVTLSNMKMIGIEQQALRKSVQKERASYQDLIHSLNETTLTFKRKTGEKDVIFGSVSSSDVKEALDELGIEIDKKKILLEEPIKRLGNYTVPIKVFHEDRAEVKVEVVREGEEAPESKGEEKPEEEARVSGEEKKEEEVEAGEEPTEIAEKEIAPEEVEPAPEEEEKAEQAEAVEQKKEEEEKAPEESQKETAEPEKEAEVSPEPEKEKKKKGEKKEKKEKGG